MERAMLQRENRTTTKSSSFFKPAIQKKLSVGSANDSYEVEADTMANKVMRMSESSTQNISHTGSLVQRKCTACEQEEKIQKKSLAENITPLIQRSSNSEAGGQAPSHVESQINSSRGGGSSMDNGTKNFMESRFGTDFSDVKIHTGSQAVQMSRELNAQAFTVGNDIYFNEGKYSPNSDSGKHLLAHELTHAVQQSGRISKSVQRSCFDGACDSCAGGTKKLTLTIMFRVRASSLNMTEIRREVREAQNVLNNCCIKLNVLYNWRLLAGGGTFDPGLQRPAGDANGSWDYDNASETLGEGNTLNNVLGIPVVIADDVPRTGGGVTVDNRYDNDYTGRSYMAISINQAGAVAQSTIAHELGHVAGLEHDSAKPNSYIMNSGEDVDATYATAVRALAT